MTKCWSTSIGSGKGHVYAWERADRGGKVFVKYTHPSKAGRDRRVKEKLAGDLVVRDSKGKQNAKLIRAVQQAMQDLSAQLQLGMAATTKADAPLTLRAGFDLALDHSSGKYPTKTRRVDEVGRARRRLEKILGPNTQWVALTGSEVRRVWRTLANEYKSGASKCGLRQTEVTVDALYSIAAWLRDEDRLPATAALPMSHWRSKLKDEWESINGGGCAPSRLRHTEAEMKKLFASMHEPSVDPRLSLAFDLGAELRMGQVIRCTRLDLELPPLLLDANSAKTGQHGAIRVPSAGKKLAPVVVLLASQRAAVERALGGYLSDLESAYRAGQIDNYPLFPAGRLKRGKVKLTPNVMPLTRDAALKMFKKLERAAGVASVAGRGWYGIRRIATDVAENFTNDERVLNLITGHRDSTTRRLVYQQQGRPEDLNRAAEVRAQVRSGTGQANARLTSETAKLA